MQIDPLSDGAATAQPRPMSDERPSPQAGELPARLGHILCLDDFERAASRHLPKPVFAYISGAVERNYSLRAKDRKSVV